MVIVVCLSFYFQTNDVLDIIVYFEEFVKAESKALMLSRYGNDKNHEPCHMCENFLTNYLYQAKYLSVTPFGRYILRRN